MYHFQLDGDLGFTDKLGIDTFLIKLDIEENGFVQSGKLPTLTSH